MDQKFTDRLQVLIDERRSRRFKDGWVYGRLKQEFDLQPEQLAIMATALGFKYGWNLVVQDLLEKQWQQDQPLWLELELIKAKNQAALNQRLNQQKAAIAHSRTELEFKTPIRAAINNELQKDLEQLNALIGLSVVKSTVQELVNVAKIAQMKTQVGMKTPDITRHLVFTGSPGTGKTTVARILGEIYKNLGVLSKGHFTEVDRSSLVAEYVGQTAPKTTNVIQSALGGVLFIDEAYALVPEGQKDPFGQEAVNTLLKMMEDYRDDLVVIVAGYKTEMSRFINSNPGLKSRFGRSVHFENYTPSELVEIFKVKCTEQGYVVSEQVLASVHLLVMGLADQIGELGNGRFARNLFDRCVVRQCNRLALLTNPSKDDLSNLLPDDVPTHEELMRSLL